MATEDGIPQRGKNDVTKRIILVTDNIMQQTKKLRRKNILTSTLETKSAELANLENGGTWE